MEASFGYNSELPGGRAPFWIKDDALAEIGLSEGDCVSVDSGADPTNGELVLVEVAEPDGDSMRTVRRYFEHEDGVFLGAASTGFPDVLVDPDQIFIVGVVRTRVRFENADGDRTRVIEDPIE